MINVCYHNNSDKIITYRQNKNEIKKILLIKFTQFSYLFFFPYPLLIICCLNPRTIITNLSIFLSSCCSVLIMVALLLQIFFFTSADAWHHIYIYLKDGFSLRVFSIWIHSFIHSVAGMMTGPQSLQGEFSAECGLMLPLSKYCIPSFP